MVTGRPKTSEEIILQQKLRIIEEMREGKSLLKVLNEDKEKAKANDLPRELPSRPTVYTWCNSLHPDFDADFFNNYVQAREDSADLDFEKAEEILQQAIESGTSLDVQKARLAFDIIRWTAGVKKPKKYKEKLDITSGGKKITQQVTVFKLPDNGRNSEK